MSKDALDITGNKYGNLTAVRYSHTGKIICTIGFLSAIVEKG